MTPEFGTLPTNSNHKQFHGRRFPPPSIINRFCKNEGVGEKEEERCCWADGHRGRKRIGCRRPIRSSFGEDGDVAVGKVGDVGAVSVVAAKAAAVLKSRKCDCLCENRLLRIEQERDRELVRCFTARGACCNFHKQTMELGKFCLFVFQFSRANSEAPNTLEELFLMSFKWKIIGNAILEVNLLNVVM